MPTWDEPKRLRNIKDHGLDFVGCEAVFDSPVVAWEDDRERYGEPHIISLRKAEKHEIRRYAKETTGYSG